MISEEKIKELRQSIKNGVPAEEIRERMLRDGYTEEDIKLVLAPKQYDMRPWFFCAAVLCFLVAFYKVVTHQKSFLMFAFAGVFYAFFEKERKRVAKENTP